VNRALAQQLADERVREAQALLAAGCWSGAFYVAGYAVELALKSCILVRVGAAPELLFEDRRFSERCWTHNLELLLATANLEADLAAAGVANPALDDSWETVKGWDESSRYETRSQTEAEDLFRAITDLTHGVLPWLKVRW
jgi:HEPN domain-containing protein